MGDGSLTRTDSWPRPALAAEAAETREPADHSVVVEVEAEEPKRREREHGDPLTPGPVPLRILVAEEIVDDAALGASGCSGRANGAGGAAPKSVEERR